MDEITDKQKSAICFELGSRGISGKPSDLNSLTKYQASLAIDRFRTGCTPQALELLHHEGAITKQAYDKAISEL